MWSTHVVWQGGKRRIRDIEKKASKESQDARKGELCWIDVYVFSRFFIVG
jgi:hypothetical protein